MAKYDPLSRYLSRQKAKAFELSFSEMERLIGALLPKAAAKPEWWRGHPVPDPRAVHLTAWRSHSLRASLLPGQDRVRFEKEEAAASS
ncbi:MAG: hypothetical protein LKF80_14660 [Brevundimonas sp.]|jgi:hypothetical protein|uniref:DUF7662 domain-containing protein n=1 Tax=Brevundimonas sp. TaxID=1871086 RepID=UPI0025BCFAC2|nr:hypothetical protein [Brevundimonas sp.]MCH4269636.1 hypothetical protein [Brevundimonas sp.]